jgi:hypothetical protein
MRTITRLNRRRPLFPIVLTKNEDLCFKSFVFLCQIRYLYTTIPKDNKSLGFPTFSSLCLQALVGLFTSLDHLPNPRHLHPQQCLLLDLAT